MTDKHTPGPWDFFVGNANGRGLIRIEAAIDSPVQGKHIASMPRGPEAEANARLIAAAPELLEALQDLLISGTNNERACNKAAAALAKARGQ